MQLFADIPNAKSGTNAAPHINVGTGVSAVGPLNIRKGPQKRRLLLGNPQGRCDAAGRV